MKFNFSKFLGQASIMFPLLCACDDLMSGWTIFLIMANAILLLTTQNEYLIALNKKIAGNIKDTTWKMFAKVHSY